MKTKTTKTAAVKTTNPAFLCLCSCGGTVSTERKGRRFLQGHDARMKGYLQRLFNDAPRKGDPELQTLRETFLSTGGKLGGKTVEDLASAINPQWSKFLKVKVAKVKREKVAKKGGKLVTRKVGRWPQKGTVDGNTFTYTDSKGKLVTVELAKTKAA